MQPTIDRLLARTQPNGECLVWTGAKASGYGVVRAGGRMRRAHRVVYELKHGTSLTPDQFVCHSCDNPPCINPEHLWLGTHLENATDKAQKMRGRGGAKLTIAQVREIRALYRRTASNRSNAASLCAKYDISRPQLRKIVYRESWRWVA